jgi:hypothetical protein
MGATASGSAMRNTRSVSENGLERILPCCEILLFVSFPTETIGKQTAKGSYGKFGRRTAASGTLVLVGTATLLERALLNHTARGSGTLNHGTEQPS